ncbi:tripeptidyl-peptidase 2-like [Rhizophagus clarus]|uniref:Tripeptidyl-peptidase 2 n=2 Tax=Rhizophagus clarus TaxID=94130 RepID=A0A8H3M0W5_9GLOM|nr:tripeptidyl-peptidase 2-like [Rhizophagus clarus]
MDLLQKKRFVKTGFDGILYHYLYDLEKRYHQSHYVTIGFFTKNYTYRKKKTKMTIKTSKPIPKFPTFGLLPKEETEAAAFLKKYPEYDGRGTVIAILDTGVDPGAVGLQKTTEGKPKIIDIIDCTGSGDVVTKTIVKASTEESSKETLHTIVGLSGRHLIIDPTWDNPSGEFHVGIKRAYELFPKELITRLTQERRQKFESEHYQLLVEVQQKLAAWEEAHPPSSTPTESDLAIKTDLEARLEVLKDALKNYDDPGIILDVVAFNDGSDWRVVVDVDESGDLRGAPLLTDYHKELQYHTFSQEDLFNFSVNIYDEGNIVSIVTAAGSHGTHVAAITAAYHPEEPALNGVAPGAQVISLKIGDTRLGSMETGAGLARAAIALVEKKCDLANMSYGEASAIPNFGHFIGLIRDEVIGKYGCIFVSSAGNSGPALSTTGSPGGTTSDVVGVGAYVSHSMVQAEYALLESVPERSYTWCSQGPCTDGDIGVTIYAPGGAITSTPLYSLTKSMLMNGTSMSSPNATGCIALLLSGLKAENKQYTPFRIKNAISNSSKSINENFGVGLLQVQKSWEYLNTYYDREDQDITFEVKINNGIKNRGIYLREESETSSPQLFSVFINPKFMKEIEPTTGENNSKKFEFETRLALVSTQPWVRSPDFLLMGSQGRSFDVKVDPTQLNPGGFYYSEVEGYDTTCPDRGPLFRVPVTVTRPIILSNSKVSFNNWSFGPGHIERRFVKVPDGATFADLALKFSASQATSPARFWLHMIQLLPQKRFTAHEREYMFSLGQGSYGDGNGEEQVEKRRFAVHGGVTLEICLAQFWSSLGNHTVSLDFVFHGLQIINNTNNGDTIYVNGGEAFTRIDVVAPVRREDEIHPSISLDVLRKPLRPAEYSLKPLSPDRDVLPNSRRVYGLLLTYKFSTTEKNVTVTPKFPAFFDLLYDSYFEDFFAIVYDSNKKVVGYLDIYAKNIKLETKGDYVIRAQVRHQSQELLEKLNSTMCFLEFSLSKKITLEVYNKISEVFTSNKPTANKRPLEKDSIIAYFIGSPTDYSTYPKEAKPGDILTGKLNFVNSNKVDGGQYLVNLVVPPAPAKPKEITPNGGEESGKEITSSEFDEAPKPEKTKEDKAVEELTEAIRDLQITHLKKFPAESTQRAELLAELENNHPTHLPVFLAKIDLLLDSDETLSPETANKVLEVADEILKKIDLTELAQYYGVKQEGNINETAKKKKKENDEKKKAVVSALRAKAHALAVLASDSTSSSSNIAATQFEETYKALAQWWDATPPSSDFKNLLIYITRERRACRYGNALKALNKYLNEGSLTSENSKDYEKALGIKIELYKDAGFTVWENYERKMKFIKVPPGGYAPF